MGPIVSGCNDPHVEFPVIEDLGMVGIMGFDYEDEENIKVTMTLSPTREEEVKQIQSESTVVQVPHQAILEMTAQSEKILSLAQLRVLLFSEEFASKVGLWEIIEHLYRDPNVGANVFIAVISGSVEEALNLPFKDKPEINTYLNELLTPRSAIAFNPFTTIHSFMYRLTDEISDPSAPYLEIVDDNSLKVTKVALFKQDKFITAITPEEAKLIEALKKRKRVPDMSIKYEEDKLAVLKFVKTDVSIRTNGDLNNPEIQIALDVRGSVIDYEGKQTLDNVYNQVQFEEKVSEELKKNVNDTISLFQQLEIDPLGLGQHMRIQNAKGWSKEKWMDAFKDAKIITEVDTTIVSPGTIR